MFPTARVRLIYLPISLISLTQYCFFSCDSTANVPFRLWRKHFHGRLTIVSTDTVSAHHCKDVSFLTLFYFSLYSQFSDVTEEDLFDALTTAVSNSDAFIPPTTNVTEIMTSWTRQAGYPLVIVERNYEQDTHLVTLSQARYFNPSPPVDPVYETYWIPYNFATPDSPYDNSSIATGWIPQGQTSVTISLSSLDADDYFLLDTNAGGYYRILYDERNYRLISDAMVRNPEQFTATSKASLLENIREFFNIQELLVNTVMDALRILENEASYIPWYPVQGLILDIDQIFSGHEAYPIFRVNLKRYFHQKKIIPFFD